MEKTNSYTSTNSASIAMRVFFSRKGNTKKYYKSTSHWNSRSLNILAPLPFLVNSGAMLPPMKLLPNNKRIQIFKF